MEYLSYVLRSLQMKSVLLKTGLILAKATFLNVFTISIPNNFAVQCNIGSDLNECMSSSVSKFKK